MRLGQSFAMTMSLFCPSNTVASTVESALKQGKDALVGVSPMWDDESLVKIEVVRSGTEVTLTAAVPLPEIPSP
jgi:hypothetical protein